MTIATNGGAIREMAVIIRKGSRWMMIGVVCAVALGFGVSARAQSRVRSSFDAGWAFTLGDPQGAEVLSFDDSSWRMLDLPHDWSVEGRFDAKHSTGAAGGYLPAGMGWYRKGFRMLEADKGRKVSIEFDGIYMNGEVWINGHHLGKRPYGYIGVEYDLTPYLNYDGVNVIAVRVDDAKQPSGRWYTGTGIYRHVWLKVTDALHVAQWGTYVTTPKITDDAAEVVVKTVLRNDRAEAQRVTVRQTILDAKQVEVAQAESAVEMGVAKELEMTQTLTLPKPMRWSPETPYLYRVRTELFADGRAIDEYHSPLGVREIRFDANEGFFLNGKSVILRGVCQHQDLGPLGTALWDQALERRMRILKEMGCNAIRTAHYPHSPEFMALCDKMGFLVVNETFDEWRRGWNFENGQLVSSKESRGKAKEGYNRYFAEWAERDLLDHLKRDRNHPSVILWSIGNEVPEAQKYGELETVKVLRDICHRVDPTRKVTMGVNHVHTANETGFLEELDVVGYNGGGGSCFRYEEDHKRFPNRIIYASEVPHSLQTRGEYRTHTNYREKQRQTPHLTEVEVFTETDPWYESSYDNAGVRINARDSWHLTRTLPFVAGEFRWTGFDYIGESGGWPRVLGNFGVIDLCHFPKDTYYFYQSQWANRPMIHLLPHWNWSGKEGVVIPVHAYSTGDEAELFLNGQSLGVRKITDKNRYHFEWMVAYAPGELKAVARKDGKVIATAVTRTAGPAAQFGFEADQLELNPDRRDLSYISIRVEDKDGNFDPKGARWVTVNIEGPGRIVGIASGDPMSHDPFKGDTVRTFNGLARVIIASTTGPDVIKPKSERKHGQIIVTASSKGFKTKQLILKRTHEGTPESVVGPDGKVRRPTDVYDEGVPPVD